jgi:predicted Rossmann fold flavoprotein
MKNKKLIVVGGGAAGFFCAINAARIQPDLEVILLEKSARYLSKVRISGGGRCNVTHACFDVDAMSKLYPRGARLMKNLLHQFGPHETIQWFQERGVELVKEADGRMFPSTNDAQTIVDCLIRDAEKYRVKLLLHQEVIAVEKENTFTVFTADGNKMTADFILIATGGYPKAEQFSWILKLGHTIESPVPSLFTFNVPDPELRKLMGISVDPVRISLVGNKLQVVGPLLITHWGISGPAALRLSAFAARELSEKSYTGKLSIHWLPDYNESTLRAQWQEWRKQYGGQKLYLRCPFTLPARLWQYLLLRATIPEIRTWAEITSREQNQLIAILLGTELEFKGKTTFKEEFVTCGGIALKEIHPSTMESKIQPGLYFGGEVVDVDGVTGGFNFQHAWASGWVAANSIAAACNKKASA